MLSIDPAPDPDFVRLSWTGTGTLEQIENFTTPNWLPAPIQDNPQILSTTNLMQFFRVKAD